MSKVSMKIGRKSRKKSKRTPLKNREYRCTTLREREKIRELYLEKKKSKKQLSVTYHLTTRGLNKILNGSVARNDLKRKSFQTNPDLMRSNVYDERKLAFEKDLNEEIRKIRS